MMRKENVRVGIIGCGNIAFQKHLPSLGKLGDEVSLVGFCDIVKERADKAVAEYGVEEATVYEDYKKLLQDESIDVVQVLTPNVSHSYITVDALEAGKHVMCEKPMAINSKEAKLMVDAAKRTGKKLTVAYQHRHRRDSFFLNKVIEDGDLGEIYFAKSHAVRRRGVPTWGVFLDKEKQGGGALIDIGTHALDLTLWLMDNYKPKSVMGSTYSKLNDKPDGNVFGRWDAEKFAGVEDSAFGYIKMENGATITLEASWALNMINAKESQVTLCGTEAGAEMFGDADANEGYVVLNTSKHDQLLEMETHPSNLMPSLQAEEDIGYLEAQRGIAAVVNDKEPMVKPEQAYAVTQVLEAIYKSAETGQSVQIDELE